jgi:hypothetical protein
VNMDLMQWATEVWQDSRKWIYIGQTSGERWPLQKHVNLRHAQLSRLQLAPNEGQYYCTLTQLVRACSSANPGQYDVAGGSVLWTEWDGYHAGHGDRPSFEITPSYTIATSPLGRQYGWLLDGWYDPETIQQYTARLCQMAKSDPIHNPNRLVRMPYGFNEKPIHGGRFQVHIEQASYRRYSLGDFSHLPEVQVASPYAPVSVPGEMDEGSPLSHREIDSKWSNRYTPKLRMYLNQLHEPRWKTEQLAWTGMIRIGMSFRECYWRWYGTPNDKWSQPDYQGQETTYGDNKYRTMVSRTYARALAFIEESDLRESGLRIRSRG